MNGKERKLNMAAWKSICYLIPILNSYRLQL